MSGARDFAENGDGRCDDLLLSEREIEEREREEGHIYKCTDRADVSEQLVSHFNAHEPSPPNCLACINGFPTLLRYCPPFSLLNLVKIFTAIIN